MHINALTVHNFKRIEAICLELPAKGTVEICGKNGAGKSSAIDSIWSALGGAKASPAQPIRNGEREASVSLDLGELRVTREWSSSGTRLTVTDASGSKMGRPQQILDGLFGRLAFDPMEFTRQEPRHQAETLRRVTGLDFSKLDQERQRLVEERKDLGKTVRSLEAQLCDMPEVEPTEEVSAAEIQGKLQDANRTNAQVAKARAAFDRKDAEVDRLTSEVSRLERELEAMRSRLDKAIDARFEAEGHVDEEVDTTELVEQLGQVEATNRRARAYQDREAVVEQLRGNREHSEDVSDAIERIDEERRQMIAQAPMPVPGLSFSTEEGIEFNGVPFDQVSTAEQIRVSLAMSAALNPKLRVILIKEGSLLDSSSLAMVAAWAEEHDYQVILERVADSPNGVGIVIEEGRATHAQQHV